MILKIVCAFFGILVLSQATSYVSYENYKVYRVVPKSEEHVKKLTDLRNDGYDFWTDVFAVGQDVRILVDPKRHDEFVQFAKSSGFETVLSISNVQELINAQLRPTRNTERLGSFTWNQYHTIEEIHAWLDELVVLYPGVVTTVTIGTTFEDRPIKGVIINFNAENREDTPLVAMIEGGIHAREWISPATVTWIIKEFLSSNDPEVRQLAERFIWHIFPVVNADGYAYTFSTNRMWRKNRNTANFIACTGNPDMGNGIDLNRNFDFVWMTTGASNNSCSDTYAGPSPASELEAQAISRHVLSLKESGNVIYYFAFHSFSQMVLVPYSHASGFGVLEAENYADMFEIAIRGAEKLTEVHGMEYLVGTSAEILYEVSGSSFDWAKGVADIPIVYLFELRDLGDYGFLLPPDQIIPNNEEIIACLLEMDRTTRHLGYYYSGTSAIFGSIATMTMIIGFLVMFH